ncbi:hypothetical protein HZ326_23239 [Fusarium oxysporum f. sp. albedinis]|nr:hypothetical protein HZ326_23239 [Fusarium oxysporum f. sp. albedinis]
MARWWSSTVKLSPQANSRILYLEFTKMKILKIFLFVCAPHTKAKTNLGSQPAGLQGFSIVLLRTKPPLEAPDPKTNIHAINLVDLEEAGSSGR